MKYKGLYRLTNFSKTSASLALISISVLRSLLSNFSAKPLIYSAFLSDRPAVRSKGIVQGTIWLGVGKLCEEDGECSSCLILLLNRLMNFVFMDFAAAPSTGIDCSRLQRDYIAYQILVET